ncbi:unnamed protein product [Discosporangium mesarthrocarpum]
MVVLVESLWEKGMMWVVWVSSMFIVCTLVLIVVVLIVDTWVRMANRRKGGGAGRSGIYSGRVWHERYKPEVHHFSYPIFYCLLDLDELGDAFPWYMWPLGSARFPALSRFSASDHLKNNKSGGREGDEQENSVERSGASNATPIAKRIRDMVELAVGKRPSGRVQLLTHLSYLGYCFNPVSFYYCLGEDGGSIDAIVAEVRPLVLRLHHIFWEGLSVAPHGSTGNGGIPSHFFTKTLISRCF